MFKLIALFPAPTSVPFSPISLISAIRQAISKSLVAYYQKYVDEASKKEIKDILISYDRSLLVADPRCQRVPRFSSQIELQLRIS